MYRALTTSIIIIVLLIPFQDLKAQNPEGEETRITVRVKSRDAKFIGNSLGGARIIIRDAESNAILAEGFTQGTTGNTTRIMKEEHGRYTELGIGDAAKFEAILLLSEPRKVTIEAIAPYDKPGANARVSTQTWLVPGKHIMGDGIILEIPGFLVDILSPQVHSDHTGEVELTANVVMMCGCPTESGGLWNSDNFEIVAWIYHDGERIAEIELDNTFESTFEGRFSPRQEGLYRVMIYAYDPKTGNTGVAKSSFYHVAQE